MSDASALLTNIALKPQHLHLVRVGLAAGLLTALVSICFPNQYKSEARILPADQRSSGGLAAAAAAVGVGIPGQEGADATYVDILNSRSVRENLLQARFKFNIRTWFFG